MRFVWLCPICERGQGHLLVPLPAQKVGLLQQPPQQGHTARIIPALTLKLFEMQKPCQRRRDGRCSAPGSCLEVHQEGPTRSAGDAPTAPVIVGQWHSSGGAWIPWAISLCSDAVACWGTSGDVSQAETPNYVTSVLGGKGVLGMACLGFVCLPPSCTPFPRSSRTGEPAFTSHGAARTSRLPHSKAKSVPHAPNSITCYLHGQELAGHPVQWHIPVAQGTCDPCCGGERGATGTALPGTQTRGMRCSLWHRELRSPGQMVSPGGEEPPPSRPPSSTHPLHNPSPAQGTSPR